MQNALGRFTIQRAILKTRKAKPFLSSLSEFLVSSAPLLAGLFLQISSPFLPGFPTRTSPSPRNPDVQRAGGCTRSRYQPDSHQKKATDSLQKSVNFGA